MRDVRKDFEIELTGLFEENEPALTFEKALTLRGCESFHVQGCSLVNTAF